MRELTISPLRSVRIRSPNDLRKIRLRFDQKNAISLAETGRRGWKLEQYELPLRALGATRKDFANEVRNKREKLEEKLLPWPTKAKNIYL